MSILQDAMRGIEKYQNVFNKLSKDAYPVLGNITQCGIIEVNNSGHVFVVANRPDYCEQYLGTQGYDIDHRYTYSDQIPEGLFTLSTNEGIKFLQENEDSLFGKKFNLWDGFSYSEKVDNNTHRYFVFTSDTPDIYDKLINNTILVKKLIKYFKNNNENLINHFREHRFNLAEEKEDYFKENHTFSSPQQNLITMLHTLGKLDKNEIITAREWQCLQLLDKNKSAQQSGDILNISRRTVEYHLCSLKQKLNVSSKSELLETIG